MRNKSKSGMLDLARQLGAMRGDRPDWYRVAEHLAAIVRPDLVDSSPRESAPPNNWLRLFQDVQFTMWLEKCGTRKACELLVNGHDSRREPLRLADGTWVIIPPVGKTWKGRDSADALRQRYFEVRRKLGSSRK
jgi:hypothetical protein